MRNKTRSVAAKKSGYKKRYLRIFSRHPSHKVIRNKILVDGLTCIRLGSVSKSACPQELNSADSVRNSSNKRLMKECFTEGNVKTALWWSTRAEVDTAMGRDDFSFPFLAKLKMGSRARGLVKINNREEWNTFKANHDSSRFIFEKFYNYAREYRLHVSAEGCFYTCRKMLKRDSPEDAKHFRNDSNCVWFMEQNEGFNKPVNWDNVVTESVKALNSVGLDVGAVDLRIQSATDSDGNRRNNPDFIVVEINSAPSLGTVTTEKYIEHLPKIVARKYGK